MPLAFLLLVVPRTGFSAMGGSLSIHDNGQDLYDLSWGALTITNPGNLNPAPTATYTLCIRQIKYNVAGACTYASATGLTGVAGLRVGGSFCASVSGTSSDGVNFDATGLTCHVFVHMNANDTITGLVPVTPFMDRRDSAGTQLGVGQSWTFSYATSNDANVTLKIFGDGVTFPAADANGFTSEPAYAAGCVWAPAPSANVNCPVKVLLDSTPRSGENFSQRNTETWDLRDTNGLVVPNGVYSLWGDFINVADQDPHDASNCPPSCPSTTRAYRGYLVDIPVDTLRISAFTATGISTAGGTGSISYNITGDASVRIVIATPGSGFVVDTNGDVQPTNGVNNTIDCSRIVKVLGSPAGIPGAGAPNAGCSNTKYYNAFNRKAGSYTETWNATDSNNVSITTAGIYSVGISARDAFNNFAMNQAGRNDQAIATTLPVDYTPTPTSPLSITAISVGGQSIALTAGTGMPTTVPNASFSQIAVTFSNSLGAAGNAPGTDTISVTGPQAVAQSGSLVISGARTNVLTFTAASAVTTPTGATPYTITINAQDAQSPAQTITNSVVTFNFTGTVGGGGGGGGGAAATPLTADQFKNSVVLGPNPVRGGPAKFNYKMSGVGNVDIDIFTLAGDRIFHRSLVSSNAAAGADGKIANTFSWPLSNDSGGIVGTGVYMVRITAHDTGGVFRTTRKIIVVK